jgi:dTDP-glucose 4,6-dehydratase
LINVNQSNVKPVIPLFEEDLEHVLEHTRPLWEEVRGKSILITGGTGFFGMWLVESFLHINKRLSLGASICILTRNKEAYNNKAPHLVADPSLSLVEGDVRSFEFPRDKSYEFVIHAGTTSSAPVPPLEMFSTIIDGTRRVLDFALQHGTKKFLFVSSGAVYGRQPAELTHVPEDFLGAPDVTRSTSAYGEGKRAGELLCITMTEGTAIECKIARCFAFVGPHLPLDAHFAIGNFIRDVMNGEHVHVGGDGTPHRSYLYAADLAIWLWTLLFVGKAGKPYNVGSEATMSIADVAKQVAMTAKPTAFVSIAKPTVAGCIPERYVPSTERARSEVRLRETIGLSDAIEKTVSWHQWK